VPLINGFVSHTKGTMFVTQLGICVVIDTQV
jgi:hypothetical protein